MLTLSDITGGYLSGHTADMYNRFKILTSRNTDSFNILLKPEEYEEMCAVLNGLQSQPLVINKSVLDFIMEHRSSLEDLGLLMPRKLAFVNMTTATNLLRYCYFNDKGGLKE